MNRAVHHLELWVSDPSIAADEWTWLLGELEWEIAAESPSEGAAWVHPDGTYLFLQRSVDQVDEDHDRLRPGLNHLALDVDTRAQLDRLRAESSAHGWHEMYADRYPHAGGEQHIALYVENSEGFEVEVVVGS